MNHKEMTPSQREERVRELFRLIAFLAEFLDYTKNDISKNIEPMVKELWALTQLQEQLGELDWNPFPVCIFLHNNTIR